jgi:hypothetical protein
MFTMYIPEEELTPSIIEFFNLPEGSYMEVEIEITYSIYGRFRQATFHEPAEYPELDEVNVKFKQLLNNGEVVKLSQYQTNFITNYLNEFFEINNWKDRIETACWEDAEQERIRFQEDLGEYMYDNQDNNNYF